MRKIFLFALCAVMIFSPSVKAADYDSLNTVCALNFAIVSVNRILAAHDRITLEYEYNRIINRLAIGNIESDPEMTALYSDLMNFITGKNIRDEEKKRLAEISRQREQESYYRAISKSFENFRAPEHQFNLLGWLANIAASTGTGYYDYQAAKEQIKREIDTSSWELTKQEIEDCNKLQVRLLNSSWRLMSQYKIPNEYRLTHENVREFLNIMNERDPSKRLGRLKFIERKFRVYPPYWYFRANAALESGNESECRKCYEKFNEVWRPVLNFDPYKLEAVKYEIRELAKSESPSSDDISKIKSLVETVRDYTSPEDWESNIFAGIVYYALGNRDEAINCIEYGNIASGLEQDISGVMLAQMNSGEINVSKITSELKILFDPEEQFNLAKKYYNGEGVSKDLTQAAYWYRKAAEGGNFKAQTNLGLLYANGEGVPKDTTQAVYWYRKAAEDGNILAQYFLGSMYENGVGVSKDLTEARKWYKMAADQGDNEAKEALERMK